jgi:MFS family permease
MTAFSGLSKNYLQLLLSRIGVGIGEAGGTPGANSIISDYFPASKRPMAMTVFALGAPIGAWIGADIAGIVNDHYNWRTVFLVLGIPGVIVGILIFLTVFGPATITAMADNDAGGVATYSIAGSTLGYPILFALVWRPPAILSLSARPTDPQGRTFPGRSSQAPAMVSRSFSETVSKIRSRSGRLSIFRARKEGPFRTELSPL